MIDPRKIDEFSQKLKSEDERVFAFKVQLSRREFSSDVIFK